MFISDLLTAAKIRFESINISMFRLEDFVNIIKFVADRRSVNTLTVYGALSNQLRCTARDVSGYLSLGWHLGIFALRYDGKGGKPIFTYMATKVAKEIAELCKDPYSNQCLETLRRIFLLWEPLRVLLEFVRARGKFDRKEILDVLGGEMRFWNQKLIELGLIKRGRKSIAPSKPFNDFVVRKFFKPLIEELQLHDVVPEKRGYKVVKSRYREPVIAAGIAHIVYSSRESTLVTPFIDDYGVDLLLKALSLAREPRYVRLIVRKPKRRDLLEKLRSRAKEIGAEVEICVSERPLHAKIYASRSEVLITSANMLKTSLLRNVEIGIVVYGYIHEVESLVNDLTMRYTTNNPSTLHQ